MKKHQTNKPAIFFLILAIIFSTTATHVSAAKAEKQMVIVIDPGHGGKDPGAVNNGVREKDIVLGVGLKLGEMISGNFSDVKVIYTRSTDIFVPLIERSQIANKNKASLFISIHANTCGTPSTRGTETFALGLHKTKENLDVAKKENSVILLEDNYNKTYEGFDPNSSESYIMFELTQDIYLDQSLSFANDIQRQFLSNSVSLDRGVKQAGFLVLRQSSMPSVLIETGFVSNPSEAKFLMSEQGQKSIAQSVFDAFKKFKSRNSGAHVLASKKEPAEKVVEKAIKSEPVANNELKKALATPADAPGVSGANETSKKIASAEPSVQTGKHTPEQPKEGTATRETKPEEPKAENDIYFCVQIGANTIPVDPVPANFKGIKNVTRDKLDKYYRYYVGKETTLENAVSLLNQIRKKFPQAFVVSFTGGKRNVINLENK